ncbi:hypothetical protein [Arthrobacter sp. NicSoilB8]|uniref:hypothetical protein n=1 Tax=Arthrobacter sp. NicSoilB8 TaxID=2830998 RepID=UPI001CC6ABF3|nr:hypothetical protein [Arthrobacter sp. NicSoilB8]
MSFWDDFWDFFWWIFTASVFFACLCGVFAIIGDLFRDQRLNGWWKAVWILFLCFLPVVTLLAHLAARCSGMAGRSMEYDQRDPKSDTSCSGTVALVNPAEGISTSRLEPSALKDLKESRAGCWFDGVRGIDIHLGSSARILPGR